MIVEVLVSYTYRHRYAKASHAVDIHLTNITASTSLSTEVHKQTYGKFFPNGTTPRYATVMQAAS